MTRPEQDICKAALHEFGKVSEAYLMRKLKISWEKAQEIVQEFYNKINT